MRIIDLTHTVKETMPLYPGTPSPTLDPVYTCEANGFRETRLQLFSHTGTHTDAPAHLFANGSFLEEYSADRFCGTALVIPCRDLNVGEEVSPERILSYGRDAESAEFLLFDFGWDRHWGKKEYFEGYPCLSLEAAAYLAQTKKKGIGFDTLSADPVTDPSLPRHRLLLGGDCLILENLRNLDQVGQKLFLLSALPLKFQGSDGAPTRAVAIVEE